MVNLHEHIERGEVPAEISVVVSSRKSALGAERARRRGIPVIFHSRRGFEQDGVFDEKGYSAALLNLLEPFEPNLIVMAGFMTRLSAPLLERYDVVNVHPALLPMFGGDGFYGHRVHEAVIEAGAKVSGATVHFADAKYDHGPIIMQEEVPVLEGDTPDSLAARVQEAERRIYPKAIALYAEGRIMREGRRVSILSSERADS